MPSVIYGMRWCSRVAYTINTNFLPKLSNKQRIFRQMVLPNLLVTIQKVQQYSYLSH